MTTTSRRPTPKTKRQLSQNRWYATNRKAGIETFKVHASRDLLQQILREGVDVPDDALWKLPPRVGDNSHAEVQRAFEGYMSEQWLGAWDDIFEGLARHHMRLRLGGTSTLTVDAIVISTGRNVDLQTALLFPAWTRTATSDWISCGG